MKRIFAKLSTWFARLAFWRKTAKASPTADPAPESAKPETGEAATLPATPVTKTRWISRLKLMLPWRRKAIPEPAENVDQTVIVKRPTQEQLEAANEIEEMSVAKPSLLARLKNKLRRQPKLEPLEDSLDESAPSAEKRARGSAAGDEDSPAETDAEDTPKLGLLKRLLATLCKKWVWIPAVSVLFLVLVVSILLIVLNATREKEKLQTELQQAQKQLKQQAVTAGKAAKVKVAPKQPTTDHGETVAAVETSIAENINSKSAMDAGDCVVTDKESVSKNLKDCIENFNKSHSAIRKP